MEMIYWSLTNGHNLSVTDRNGPYPVDRLGVLGRGPTVIDLLTRDRVFRLRIGIVPIQGIRYRDSTN